MRILSDGCGGIEPPRHRAILPRSEERGLPRTLVSESTLRRNPADDHTRFVFDKSIIGRTDQFIYKFRKP